MRPWTPPITSRRHGTGSAPKVAPTSAGISLGAVAFGAFTYIGNAPNFMVRAIAVETGVSMPGFAGYLAYSLPVLIPLFALVGALFLVR